MGNQVPKKGQEPQGAPVKKTAPEASQQQKAVKIQKTMLVLDRQIKIFEDKQKKSEVVVEQLKGKAKQLVQMGKKVEAKKYLQQATRLKKQAQNYTVRRKVLQNKKFQLQTAMMDKNTVSSLESAQQHLKDQQKVNDKLEEIIYQTQQQKMVQDQLNDKLKDMAEDDDLLQDVDDMMAQIEKQLNKQKGPKIPQKTVTTNVNAQKQKQKDAQEDQISKMMAEL